MAQISSAFMQAFTVGVSTRFNQYIQAAPSMFGRVAMVVSSTTRENIYPKMDEIPGLRRWVGDRVVHDLSAGSFTIPNEKFEETIGISRDDIEDDQFGLFNIGIDQLAKNAAALPDELVFGLLGKGNSTLCYDGQYFFDTDHTTFDANGRPITYSNSATALVGETNGPAWYLFDDSQPLKGVIFQTRRAFGITAKTSLTDDNVFERDQFLWGTDGRCAVGFGLWQVAYRSTRPLTKASYAAARAAMQSLRRMDGVPYGIKPSLLLVPPSLEGAANALMKNDLIASLNADGATYTTTNNEWKGTAEPLTCPYLS